MNKNKKIIMLISDLSIGGAQRVFISLANYLYKKNYEVKILVQNLENPIYKKDINKNIEVISLSVKSTKKMLPKMYDFFKNESCDMCIPFSPELAVNLYIIRKISHDNFIIMGRCINTLSFDYKYAKSFFRKYISRLLVKIFYHRIDCVIAQSNGMKEDLVKNFSFNDSKVNVINNPLSNQFEDEIQNTVDGLKKDYDFLYVGRFEQQKGLKMLIDAFSTLNMNYKLVLVGDGSEKSSLRDYIASKELSDNIIIEEYSEDIISIYNRSRVLVLSSYYEGFPNVLIESIACGTPVVSYDMPSGADEIVEENINGYLVKYLDVDSLALAMNRAINKKWNNLDIKKTASKYSSDIILNQYIELIEKLVF